MQVSITNINISGVHMKIKTIIIYIFRLVLTYWINLYVYVFTATIH